MGLGELPPSAPAPPVAGLGDAGTRDAVGGVMEPRNGLALCCCGFIGTAGFGSFGAAALLLLRLSGDAVLRLNVPGEPAKDPPPT